jgi:hypothetical protein
MMFPTISLRSLVTGMMKSRRTLYKLNQLHSTHTHRPGVPTYSVPVKRVVLRRMQLALQKGGCTYHSSRVVTHRILCSLSNIVCRLARIER